MIKIPLKPILFTLVLLPVPGFADSNNINQVEHPYVQPQETELSLNSLYQKNASLNKKTGYVLKHTLGFGQSLSDKWFAKLSVSSKKEPGLDFDISSYEAELKWQITEQGEYSADYGLMISYENENDLNIKGLTVQILAEKELGKWLTTANLKGTYEQGTNIENEVEPSLSLQAKYRYKATFEPAIEAYLGEVNNGIGPVLTGVKRLAPGKKLKWEAGLIIGIDKDSADQTFRTLLEYEF